MVAIILTIITALFLVSYHRKIADNIRLLAVTMDTKCINEDKHIPYAFSFLTYLQQLFQVVREYPVKVSDEASW